MIAIFVTSSGAAQAACHDDCEKHYGSDVITCHKSYADGDPTLAQCIDTADGDYDVRAENCSERGEN
jgi:hypothetical protein